MSGKTINPAEDSMRPYLDSGQILRTGDAELHEMVQYLTGTLTEDSARARELFYFVRDKIKYNPYSPFFLPEHYWPVTTLRRGEGYCVQKAVLLAGLARAAGIPARLAFADIINHRFSEKLAEHLGTNLFVYHGYTEIFLAGKWVKATPAFDRQLCAHMEISPVEFDGVHDAVFPHLDPAGRPHIEYVSQHGSFSDVPLDSIMAAWAVAYSPQRVSAWKEALASLQA